MARAMSAGQPLPDRRARLVYDEKRGFAAGNLQATSSGFPNVKIVL